MSDMGVPSRKTIFLAENHQMCLDGLSLYLEGNSFTIVGKATNGQEALEKILTLRPDIAILDVCLAKISGIDITRNLSKRKIKTKIILLSGGGHQEYVDEVLKIGVGGYVLKDNSMRELMDAIMYTLEEKTWVSPILSAQILRKFIFDPALGLDKLTSTERKILLMLSESKTSPEISKILSCSPRTVQNHRANICAKLNLKGKNALLNYVLKHVADL